MDHHATTPIDGRVLDAMMPWLTDRFGNAASTHGFGREARVAVETARAQVASLLGGRSDEVVFTSGATESDNLAIKGVAHALADEGKHIIASRIEHKAILDSCRRLEREGFSVTWLDVDSVGRVDPEDVQRALTDETVLVSVMLANNEVGAVQDIGAIGEITRERGVWLHCDAVQGIGRVPFDVDDMSVDLASVTAHKIHGPKGVGALWVRRRGPRVRLVAEIDGGGQERGMRSGTANVAGAVGLGVACQLLIDEGEAEAVRVGALRDRLRERICGAIGGVTLNGPDGPGRLPGNLNLAFDDVDGVKLLLALHRVVAVSSGAACTSASVEPSYVLRAMGVSVERATASIRYGLGRDNTEAQVDEVAAATIAAVTDLRAGGEERKLADAGVDPESVDW